MRHLRSFVSNGGSGSCVEWIISVFTLHVRAAVASVPRPEKENKMFLMCS
jgi:hypothetical protein